MRFILFAWVAFAFVCCGAPQALPKGPPPEYEIEGLDAAPATAVMDASAPD